MKKILPVLALALAGCRSAPDKAPQWESGVEAKSTVAPYNARVTERVDVSVSLKVKW